MRASESACSGSRFLHFSGELTLGQHDTKEGDNAVAAGNLLHSPAVVEATIKAIEASLGDDPRDRLLNAMHAAIETGEEEGPIHFAGMLLVDQITWPIVSLRVDWTEDDPITAPASIWRV